MMPLRCGGVPLPFSSSSSSARPMKSRSRASRYDAIAFESSIISSVTERNVAIFWTGSVACTKVIVDSGFSAPSVVAAAALVAASSFM